MRLEPLYRIRFSYPESWAVGLDGGWQQMFFLAEGRCEGLVTGRFRGANFPRKEGAEGPFRPDFRAVIEADDRSPRHCLNASTPPPLSPGHQDLIEPLPRSSAPPPGTSSPASLDTPRWLACSAPRV
jgi:hypothetical protein